MSMSTIERVAEFHRVFNPSNTSPPGGTPDNHVRLTRVQLMQEELAELAHAFAAGDLVEALDALTDLQYVLDGTLLSLGARPDELPVRAVGEPAERPGLPAQYERLRLLAMLQKALARTTESLYSGHRVNALMHLRQLQAALDAAYTACGLDAVREVAFEHVHQSNMSKLGADGRPIVNAAGRVVKGPDYWPPDLAQFLPPKPASVFDVPGAPPCGTCGGRGHHYTHCTASTT